MGSHSQLSCVLMKSGLGPMIISLTVNSLLDSIELTQAAVSLIALIVEQWPVHVLD